MDQTGTVEATLVDAIRHEILRSARSRPKHIDRAGAVRIGQAIAEYVREYHKWRRWEKDPAAQQVRDWVRKTAVLTQELTAWIGKGPGCPCGRSWEMGPAHECESSSHLNGEFFADLDEARLKVTQPLDVFRQWLDDQYCGDAFPAHRPADPTREDLELAVGFELFNAAIPLRTGPEGIFGRILAVVYANVGIDATTDGAIIRVFDHHPEWRT
jgi:hypothetical protein